MDVKKKTFDVIKFLTEKNKHGRINICEKTMLSYYICMKNTSISCENIMTKNKLFTEKCSTSSYR